MGKLKIGLIGCGRISYKHLQAIEDNCESFKLVGVCDVDIKKAKQVADKYNIPFFTDLVEMLKQLKHIDIVSLCTPSGLHAQQSVLSSQFGKHVICEKPMACNLQDAREMLRIADLMQTQLFIVKQNRLNPTVQALKQEIDKGSFGKIFLVQSNVFWARPQKYYDQASWRGTWSMDGGAFMNQASHYVDLLEWLVGRLSSVQAITKTLARNIEAEDSGVVNFEWDNGAIGSMAVTVLTYPSNIEGSIIIIGEKGTVRLDGIALNEIKYWKFKDTSLVNFEELNYQPVTVYGNGHSTYYNSVAATLLEGKVPIADGKSGLNSIEVLVAIYKAAQTGNKVEMSTIKDMSL